jgi:aminoglycoside phosphotransferase
VSSAELTEVHDAVVARDTRLRALPLVLDDRRLARALVRRWPDPELAPVAVRVDYLRYKPGTSIVAGLRLHFDDDRVVLAALYGATSDDDPKLAKVRARARDVGDGFAVASRRRHWVLTPATADRKLRAVASLARTLEHGDRDLRAATLVPLAYKPLRRFVARVDRRGRPRAVAKVHRRGAVGDVAGVARWVRSVAAPAGLPLPVTRRLDAANGLHVTDWRRGTPLDRLEDPPAAVLGVLGEVLARLHRSPADGLPSRPDDDRVELDTLAAIRPDAARAAAPVVRTLQALPRGQASCPVHGDLSADQVVVDGRDVGLVDLDRFHVGEPLEDLASWIAADAIARDDYAPDRLQPPAAMLAAYRAAGGPADLRHLRTATAAALLHRSAEPFRVRRPDWPARTDRLVDAARRLTGLGDGP